MCTRYHGVLTDLLGSFHISWEKFNCVFFSKLEISHKRTQNATQEKSGSLVMNCTICVCVWGGGGGGGGAVKADHFGHTTNLFTPEKSYGLSISHPC